MLAKGFLKREKGRTAQMNIFTGVARPFYWTFSYRF